jgi:hypothetical protein
MVSSGQKSRTYPNIDLFVQHLARLDVKQFRCSIRHGGMLASDILLQQRLLPRLYIDSGSTISLEAAGIYLIVEPKSIKIGESSSASIMFLA